MLQNNFKKGEDFFNDTSLLEPRCSSCNTKINFGVTTEWSDKHDGHICKECGTKVE